MQADQRERYLAYRRAYTFMQTHPLPAPATYGASAVLLDDVIARLTEHSAEQETGIRLSRANKRAQKNLRGGLLRELRPMATVGRVVLRAASGAGGAFRMPRTQTTIGLLGAAQAFREIGATHESVFVEHGLPPDFLSRLDKAMQALEQSLSETNASLRRHVGARAGIASEIRRGRDALELLGVLVMHHFEDSADVLAAWRSATRLKQRAQPRRTSVKIV